MSWVVRRATVDDADAVAQLYDDPSAYAGTLQLPYPLPSTWRERLAQTDNTVHLLACSGDEVIGSAALHPNLRSPRRAHAASLGMAVPKAWQHKGVGTALLAAIVELADNWYGLARLELTVYTDNAAALGLYKKFGFEIEGTLRSYALRAGALVDTFSMARLRERPR